MVDRIILRMLRRLHSDERGFSLVESVAAITILAVGAFSAAQALGFGLTTSGLSRQGGGGGGGAARRRGGRGGRRARRPRGGA